jgi:hypothetical protein
VLRARSMQRTFHQHNNAVDGGGKPGINVTM